MHHTKLYKRYHSLNPQASRSASTSPPSFSSLITQHARTWITLSMHATSSWNGNTTRTQQRHQLNRWYLKSPLMAAGLQRPPVERTHTHPRHPLLQQSKAPPLLPSSAPTRRPGHRTAFLAIMHRCDSCPFCLSSLITGTRGSVWCPGWISTPGPLPQPWTCAGRAMFLSSRHAISAPSGARKESW
jgi:hypothetical protein